MPELQMTVEFAEIFRYAESKHGIQWNPCNVLFFRTEVIMYHSVTGWNLGECLPDYLLDKIVGPDYEVTPEIVKSIMSFTTSNEEVCSLIQDDFEKLADIASLIISQFAIENNLTEFLILAN